MKNELETTSQSTLVYNDTEWRNVHPLPRPDEFFELLYDRLNACVENMLLLGDTHFTMFINAIDRKGPHIRRFKRDESPEFIYAGLSKQRELLRQGFELPQNHTAAKVSLSGDELNDAWEYLSQSIITTINTVVTSSFYYKIIEGSFKLIDTRKVNSLNDYFNNPNRTLTKEQLAEKAIISAYFDIEKDVYISLPLIGFGEIDGIVHIIFKNELGSIPLENKESSYLSSNTIWSLIRAFTFEYDGLFLDWESIDDNLERRTSRSLFLKERVFSSDEYFNIVISGNRRPEILRELKLLKYYKNHADYFDRRLSIKDDSKLYQQYITNAVTAVLIDSYAHNISAHALSTLSWWFYRRSDIIRDEELDWDALFDALSRDPLIEDQLAVDKFRLAIDVRAQKRIDSIKDYNERDSVRQRSRQIKEDAKSINPKDGKAVIRYPGSLDRELFPMLRYLTEKGAFWSGITRDVNVGGKVSNLYNILWYDFINNPFYLGAIAKTEDITRIKLRIVLYEDEPRHTGRSQETLFHKKKFHPDDNGIFAEVDFLNLREILHSDDSKTYHDKTLSLFVKKGFRYEHLRNRLKKINIFFPGGVVGRHAFYTMIENEIRNVKHYSREELCDMQENGLTLAIGIQLVSLHNSTNHELYRITVWLDTLTDMSKDKDEHLIKKRWKILDSEIFDTETYAPLLGGTYQDKVCAGFLLNGRFSKVQAGDRNRLRKNKSEDTDRDKQHYPWVRPACSRPEADEEPNTHVDYKISYNNPLEKISLYDSDAPYRLDLGEKEDPMVDENLPACGFLKKIFYVWRGENMLEWTPEFLTNGEKTSWDNPSRYNLVYLPKHIDTGTANAQGETIDPLYILRRKEGVVRVVRGAFTESDKRKRYAEAYKLWLYTLIGQEALSAQVIMREGDQRERVLALQKNQDNTLHFVMSIEENPQNNTTIDEVLDLLDTDEKLKREWEILVAHRENDWGSKEHFCVRYRNHGVFKTHFLPQNAPSSSTDDILMMELFEVLATKVCIFDSRVYQRIRQDKDQNPKFHAFYRDRLKLAVFEEKQPRAETKHKTWRSFLAEEDLEFVKKCHFLVMHLSFIESILKEEIPNIDPQDRSNVGLFIEQCIIPIVGQRDNFFFVVTTGRGRNEWWTSLDADKYRDYAKFTIFRAIESLLTSIENSVSMRDDVELKYRIVKTLYGS